MTWVTGSAVYFVIWWLTIFIVLPFGVHRDQEVEEGNDLGAPVKSQIPIKLAVNTVLAFMVWLVVYLIDVYDLITFNDIFVG
jgi:predicted secreted protein